MNNLLCSIDRLRTLLTIGLLLVVSVSNAQQEPPYWAEVQKIILKDVTNPSPRKEILFIGSSSFTMWKNVQECFPSKVIANNAFGGSTLQDQIRYFDYIVTPYAPRQVVIYCGENDIAYGEGAVTAQEVLSRTKTLIQKIRSAYPKTYITFVSLKPSPSRKKYQESVKESNRLIKEYLNSIKRSSFVDVYSSMVTETGESRPELFGEDQLHMNEKGYQLWTRLLLPHLR